MRHFYTLFFKNKHRWLLLIGLFMYSTVSWGQTDDFQQQKDSLIKVIPTLEGEEKLDAYNRLISFHFSDDEADEKFKLYDEFAAEAHKQGNIEKETYASFSKLNSMFNYNRRNEFLAEIYPCLDLLKRHERWFTYYKVYGTLLEVLLEERQYERSIREAKELYDFAKSNQHIAGMVTASYSIALIYQQTDRVKESEIYYRQVISLEEEMDMEWSYTIRDAYYGLCEVLSEQKKFDEIYPLLDKWKILIEREEKAEGARRPVAWYNYYLISARTHTEAGNYKKAEEYCDLADNQLPGSERAMINTCYYRSRIYEAYGMYEKSLAECEKSYQYCLDTGNAPFLQDILTVKLRVLATMHGAKEIPPLVDEILHMKDSIRSLEINAQIDELRTQYEVDIHIAEKEKARLSFYFAMGIGALLLVVLIIWILYSRKILKKNVALVDKILAQESTQAEIEKLKKIAQETNATISQADELFTRLENLMREQKPYIETDCNRKKLADIVGTNEKYLSESIKNNTGLSVSEYIMNYRLRHANTLLLRPSTEYTIDAVATDSGFGSRSKFHEHYRNHHGITPNEFRKAIESKR